MEILTDHNKSESLVTKITNEVDGSKLYIVYKAKPLKVVESKDEINFGTIILRLDEDVLEDEEDCKNVHHRSDLLEVSTDHVHHYVCDHTEKDTV